MRYLRFQQYSDTLRHLRLDAASNRVSSAPTRAVPTILHFSRASCRRLLPLLILPVSVPHLEQSHNLGERPESPFEHSVLCLVVESDFSTQRGWLRRLSQPTNLNFRRRKSEHAHGSCRRRRLPLSHVPSSPSSLRGCLLNPSFARGSQLRLPAGTHHSRSGRVMPLWRSAAE